MKYPPPNQYRQRQGPMGTDDRYEYDGLFIIPTQRTKISPIVLLCCISTIHPDKWEHVSVSCKSKKGNPLERCPTWEEMCIVKDLFWDEHEAVFQFHPPKSEYVNCHPYVLHLWKQPPGADLLLPPSEYAGPSEITWKPFS